MIPSCHENFILNIHFPFLSNVVSDEWLIIHVMNAIVIEGKRDADLVPNKESNTVTTNQTKHTQQVRHK